MSTQYPEHDRMRAVMAESQAIGEFIEWLGTQRAGLGEWRHVPGYRDEQFTPMSEGIDQVLARHFGIDLDKIEAEKRQMLAELRESTQA